MLLQKISSVWVFTEHLSGGSLDDLMLGIKPASLAATVPPVENARTHHAERARYTHEQVPRDIAAAFKLAEEKEHCTVCAP